jgi:hypothetical protein
MSAMSPEYVQLVTSCGAVQADSWRALVEEDESVDPFGLYPGGDFEDLADDLQEILDLADFVYERHPNQFLLPFEDDTTIVVSIFQGMVWTYTYLGGMPGNTPAERGQLALELLERNWDDPFGRLSLDWEDDLLWECQWPLTELTPDFMVLIVGNCLVEIEDYWDNYGYTPLQGG